MALTATATRSLQKDIEDILGMKNPIVVALPPSRPNIMYAVGVFKSVEDTFSPLLERLRKKRYLMPRVIVYCRTYSLCADLYEFFKSSLGGEFTEPTSEKDMCKYALANMFLGCTPSVVKAEILKQFSDPNAPLRIIFATSLFGMGVDCCDVQQVIHVGVPDDIEAYIQGTGRAGRNGEPALGLLLKYGRSNKYANKEMLEYQNNECTCRRNFLFRDIHGYNHSVLSITCLCCDLCSKNCDCGNCSDNHSSFVFIGK